MIGYIYSVLFLNTLADDDDQDREWVACIIIDAETPEAALAWGDSLARERGKRYPGDIFQHSSVEPKEQTADGTDWTTVPHIVIGERASDEKIGW